MEVIDFPRYILTTLRYRVQLEFRIRPATYSSNKESGRCYYKWNSATTGPFVSDSNPPPDHVNVIKHNLEYRHPIIALLAIRRVVVLQCLE